MSITRLFVGGPFDGQYKEIDDSYITDEKRPIEVIEWPNEPILYNDTNQHPESVTLNKHLYFPFPFYYSGDCQHIIMLHKSIDAKNAMSVILKGYAKNCLH